jgi:hypothetical protein
MSLNPRSCWFHCGVVKAANITVVAAMILRDGRELDFDCEIDSDLGGIY